MQNRFIYVSIPGENAGVITVAHVPSDRALMLFGVHIPFTPELLFEEQVSYSRLLCRDLTIRSAGNMAESNPSQICPVWIKTASKARPALYSETLSQIIKRLPAISTLMPRVRQQRVSPAAK